ncbi:aminomethyl-transferring glycine dehydrogenase subunit GcvPA [Halocella sp. SP3-1]|uniref:aminomethyl-transferring glycine dehydrogenase subunit GcvPA n=1 Tax=Halocella sp. SP3-1 TaxID=2382161 RepID=UPI000F763ECD|nr:aminomethyl-transferring glycine dehydrogenase subunit GcvPA [Halocella sp. SP3-1]AZO93581.1 aminomethyl-transferring glycine dehydrogenase subunit GcvPA [Halocella sp. SP3-1]
MDYIANTPQEKEEMLAAIGVQKITELFSGIPRKVKLDSPLGIPAGISEMELVHDLKEIAQKNLSLGEVISFLGAGAYDHYIPAIVDHLILRSEFYTAYTPYQAELSQGTLQAVYEYQSMISDLTAMDLANASLLDGGSALGEAVLMASRISRKKKILISQSLHPAYREVARTYGRQQGLEFIQLQLNNTVTDLLELEKTIDQETAAVVVQYPNFFGSIEDMNRIENIISPYKNVLLLMVVNPLALGLLRPPGDFGADIVIGEGQVLGSPLNYGGPYLGFMAVKKRYLRQMPGRVVGATTDESGKRGFVLTMQTREQHIRREKATSNICTNEALNALSAAIYMSIMGRQGLREVAEQCCKKAHYLANRINKIPGFKVVNKSDYFHEFLLETDYSIDKVKKEMSKRGVIAGVDISRFDYKKEGLLVCVTEKRNRGELDKYLTVLEAISGE